MENLPSLELDYALSSNDETYPKSKVTTEVYVIITHSTLKANIGSQPSRKVVLFLTEALSSLV